MVLFFRGSVSAASKRSWTLAFTCHLCFSSHSSCGVNCFSKQSAVVLAFSNGWNFIPKEPWKAVGALGPSLVVWSFAMGRIAWGVTPELAIFYSHLSSALLWVMRLIVFEIQFNASLHVGSLVSCHSFLNLFLCFSNLSKPGISVFNSESLILLVDSLYAEAMEAVNSSTVLSASTPELISFLGDIKLETSFWNRSQSVNFSSGSDSFLVVTWSSMWNTICKWSESRISETMTC
jgi:hypothetical protein